MNKLKEELLELKKLLSGLGLTKEEYNNALFICAKEIIDKHITRQNKDEFDNLSKEDQFKIFENVINDCCDNTYRRVSWRNAICVK